MAAAAAITGFFLPASAQNYENGVLYTSETVTTVAGFNVNQITFGLEPGVCTGEITAPAEWLTMSEGTMSFAYTDGETVERGPGEEWVAARGTQLEVCNVGEGNAVVVGIQIIPA